MKYILEVDNVFQKYDQYLNFPFLPCKMLAFIFILSIHLSRADWSRDNFDAQVLIMMETHQITSCKPGYVLLSCGIDDIGHYDLKDQYSSFANKGDGMTPGKAKYAHPFNETSCACVDQTMNKWLMGKLLESKDFLGKFQPSTCIAWCYKTTDATNFYSSATSSRLFRTMNAVCPSDSKTTGCHMQFGGDRHGSVHIEVGRFYYPVDDGKSCFCQDTIGSKCISSCAGGIEGYEIEATKGFDDVIHAHCPDGSVVLGCGVKPEFMSDDGKYERFPTSFVSGLNSCTCHSYNGAACFAVCAKSLK